MRTMHLDVAGPFHLEATVRILQRRPTDRLDHLVDGGYLRLHRTSEGLILARLGNRGTLDAPDLRLAFLTGRPSPATRLRIAATTRRLLGLDQDVRPIERRLRRIPALRSIGAQLRGMRPPRFASLLESFGRTVPYQQLSLEAGGALTNRMVEHLGDSLDYEGKRYFVFPTAERLASTSESDFRALGFSRTKGRTLIGAAAALRSGELVPEELEALPTPEVWQRLRALPGIGPWTASLILLRGLGRLEAFPASDVGVNRGLASLLGKDPRHFEAARFAEPLGPQRGMLYFYSLGAHLLAKGWIAPADGSILSSTTNGSRQRSHGPRHSPRRRRHS